MKAPSRITFVTAALLVLLPALAVLQYRWVGELGDAARDRMRRNLHNAAQQFRDSFDLEIARAFVSLQVHGTVADDRYAERYTAWASTTAFPWIVTNVYLVEEAERALRLRRWDPKAAAFVPAEWEGALERLRPRFAQELASFVPGGRPLAGRGFGEDEQLLVAPLLHVHQGPGATRFVASGRVFGFSVIQLDLPAIQQRLLPALAQRHFSRTDADGYEVAIVRASDPRAVLYRSAPEAPTDPERADVSVALFPNHPDPALVMAGMSGGDTADKRNLFVSVVRERRDDRVTIHSAVANAGGGRWRLLARHERGSLEAAVGDARRGNLFISFGILLLMGVSVGLLAVSSRRAQRLAQQRMELVAGVSHELRTPVAVIQSAAENLSQGVVGDGERVRRYGEAIELEARRLREMVERVLHFAGIESGRVVHALVSIEPIIEESIAAAVAAAEDRVTVQRDIAPDLPLVLGDAAALRSAIQNLVSNAIKYGGRDRWIRVAAEAGRLGHGPVVAAGDMRFVRERRRHRSDLRITVEDHGAGIPGSDLPLIFEPFYRGSAAAARQIHGSGLGLALVRAVAHAHGGSVTIVTREGAGTAFTLHLPAAAATKEPLTIASTNEAAAR